MRTRSPSSPPLTGDNEWIVLPLAINLGWWWSLSNKGLIGKEPCNAKKSRAVLRSGFEISYRTSVYRSILHIIKCQLMTIQLIKQHLRLFLERLGILKLGRLRQILNAGEPEVIEE